MDNFLSVYRDHFRRWNIKKREPFRMKDTLKSPFDKADAEELSVKPFHGTTSYKYDYVLHPVQPRTPKPVKAKEDWPRKTTPFGGNTEYCEKFKPWTLPPVFHREIKGYVPPTARMDFLSTMHADYKAHECQRIKLARPLTQQNWQKSMNPFQTTSTMKEDYKIWDVARPTPFIHKGELEWPNEVVENATTYRTEFTPKFLNTFHPPKGDNANNVGLIPCPLCSV